METRLPLALLAAALLLTGCGDDPLAPAFTARVVSIVPSGGATGVDPNAPTVITFSHAMHAGMEMYAALHNGDVRGAVVPGTWTWSADRTTLTFTPAHPLKLQTRYAIHLGGGMRATDGGFVDYGSCVGQHGGQWATRQMMGGGMANMLGPGWRHPNGTYGMVFTFTTG